MPGMLMSDRIRTMSAIAAMLEQLQRVLAREGEVQLEQARPAPRAGTAARTAPARPLVVDDHDLHHASIAGHVATVLWWGATPLVSARQPHDELREPPGARCSTSSCAVVLLHDDVVADRQAEAGALAGGLGGEERVEDAIADLGGMPSPLSRMRISTMSPRFARADLQRRRVARLSPPRSSLSASARASRSTRCSRCSGRRG